MKIQLDNPAKFIIQPEISFESDTIETTGNFTDDGKSLMVEINVNAVPVNVTLWEGQDYLDAGQWTDEDVQKRFKEIYSKK